MEAPTEQEPRLLAQVIHAWRYDHDLSADAARRFRRICLYAMVSLGAGIAAYAFYWAEFSRHRTRESFWLAMLSLLFIAIGRATPQGPAADGRKAALVALWCAFLSLGILGVVVSLTTDAHVSFPTGAFLGAGVFGLWECRPRRSA